MSADGASIGQHERIAQYSPDRQRQGKALCLSGGGYRAALFHLGVCRRLHELSVLQQLGAVSSVSGGSIFAAHLARCIVDAGGQIPTDYECRVAVPFRQFVKHDIRTGPALQRLWPWNWFNPGAGAEALAGQYDKYLAGEMTVGRLPAAPQFFLCATDLVFGVNWVFSKGRVGDYMAGYMARAEGDALPLATAVAASSCFPPVFRPLPLHLRAGALSGGRAPSQVVQRLTEELVLSDGGVYDNLGLEPVWKTYQSVIVSDAGKPFTFSQKEDAFNQLYRIYNVASDQAEAVRKRWLIDSYVRGVYDGAYLGIHNSVGEFPAPPRAGYTKPLATDVLAQIRTDMDVFSDVEIAVLENHGYTLADAACAGHIPWSQPAATPAAPPAPDWWPAPGPKLAGLEDRIRRELADSSRRRLCGR